MLEESRLELAKHRITKAEDCYCAAHSLLNDGLYSDSANRSYYAIFHAVRALLATEKQSGVISYFQQHYVKTGIFEKEFSDILRDAFSIRQNSDYEDFFIVSKADVVEQLQNARRFLNGIEAYLHL